MMRILRAAPTLLRIGLADAFAYRTEFLVWVLTTTLPLIMLALWSAAVQAGGPVGRFGQADFVAYYLAALIVRQMSGSWVVWSLNMEIRQGILPMRLVRPLHPLVYFAAESLAALPLRGVIAIPVALFLLFTAGANHVTHDPLLLAMFLVSLLGAWLLQFSVLAILGTLGMFIESSLALFDVWLGLFSVLSGYLVPLELFPRWVHDLTHWLPFRYILGFPAELLTRGLTRAQAAEQLAIQWGFAFLMAFAAARLWKAGLRRYEAYGG
jgi:viologen exporter family transport system permease protein